MEENIVLLLHYIFLHSAFSDMLHQSQRSTFLNASIFISNHKKDFSYFTLRLLLKYDPYGNFHFYQSNLYSDGKQLELETELEKMIFSLTDSSSSDNFHSPQKNESMKKWIQNQVFLL